MSAVLRPWEPTDLELISCAFDAPDISRMLWIEPGDDQAIAAWLDRRVAETSGTSRSFALEVGTVPVGELSLSRIDRHGCAWLAYWLVPEARGRGHVTRAAATLVQWGFDQLGLERIELCHRLENTASAAIAARLGFVREGVQREKLRYGTTRYDVAACARLRSDPVPAIEPIEIHVPTAVTT